MTQKGGRDQSIGQSMYCSYVASYTVSTQCTVLNQIVITGVRTTDYASVKFYISYSYIHIRGGSRTF